MTTRTDADHRPDTQLPVRRALGFLIGRGAASFAVAVLAVLPIAISLEGEIHELGHALLPGLLVFVIVARGLHLAMARPRLSQDGVWARAYGIEPTETMIAAFTAIAVPVAWLVGGSAILIHHSFDAAPTPGAIAAIYAPLFLAAWLLATLAWLGDCRERLARAFVESERLFRAYWERIGVASRAEG